MREKNVRTDDSLESCWDAGCTEKIRKIHSAQWRRRWDAHPPEDFEKWWHKHLDFTISGVAVKVAWNCQRYRQEFLESKQFGLPETFQDVKAIMDRDL